MDESEPTGQVTQRSSSEDDFDTEAFNTTPAQIINNMTPVAQTDTAKPQVSTTPKPSPAASTSPIPTNIEAVPDTQAPTASPTSSDNESELDSDF